jgi:hypothetical protein
MVQAWNVPSALWRAPSYTAYHHLVIWSAVKEPQTWGASYPWTGMVQAWHVPSALWRAPTGNSVPPQAMVAQAPSQQQFSFGAPPNLYTALHDQPSSTVAYTGSGDWFLDTGASSHMIGNSSIATTGLVPPCSSHVIIGNGASLPVTHTPASSLFLLHSLRFV